jgi:hypothetical protein
MLFFSVKGTFTSRRIRSMLETAGYFDIESQGMIVYTRRMHPQNKNEKWDALTRSLACERIQFDGNPALYRASAKSIADSGVVSRV